MIKIISNSGDIQNGIYQYVIDSVEELGLLPNHASMGSKAFIIATNQNYIKNGIGDWVELNDDTELQQIIDANKLELETKINKNKTLIDSTKREILQQTQQEDVYLEQRVQEYVQEYTNSVLPMSLSEEEITEIFNEVFNSPEEVII